MSNKVQISLPFKARKRSCIVTSKKRKSNEENECDKEAHVAISLSRNKHKRKICADADTNPSDDTGSPTCTSHKQSKPVEPDIIDECPLPGRENEIVTLRSFLEERLTGGAAGGAMYVCGAPGTGKTASLTHVLQTPQISSGYKAVVINCTGVSGAAALWGRVAAALGAPASGGERAAQQALKKYSAKHPNTMLLLVLDEIDQLSGNTLYSVWEWAGSMKGVVVVGVANSLDLPARQLQRLGARHALQTLHFTPYNRDQIEEALRKALQRERISLEPPALKMLAAKVSAVSGDMRRALGVARRAAQFALPKQTAQLTHVLRALSDVYGGADKLDNQVKSELPLQQKLVLCVMVLLQGNAKGNKGALTLGRLHDVYRRVCSRRNIAPLQLDELLSVCGLLTSRGALRVATGTGRARRVTLTWDASELEAALRDTPLLSAVLADTSVLTAH